MPDRDNTYEHFLAAHDPELRRRAGVYYTPAEVVRCQVRLVDELLRTRFDRPLGFAERGVLTVDPAAGTGAYLLAVAEYATLPANLRGFEIMPEACRIARGQLGPMATIAAVDALQQPTFREADAEVLVCLGNPPYDRGRRTAAPPYLDAFVEPARAAGHSGDLKNLYNLYVYFWRWALLRVFERNTEGAGIVSFITASSYLEGDAFVGMREQMRRLCDEVWIIDLGGEGRAARRTANVFDIQTPVAIAMAARYGVRNPVSPAPVHYARIEGSREEKLLQLDSVSALADFDWSHCPPGRCAPFRPAAPAAFFEWPRLTDLFPWQHSGVQLKRTWPVAPSPAVLEVRWRALLASPDRAAAFRETGDRTVEGRYGAALPISALPRDAPAPRIVRYGYRSFDRQFLLADGRLISRQRPPLWAAHGPEQLYFATLLSQPLGEGPALTVSADIPDMDYFRGSFGAKAAIPLWLDAAATRPNLMPGVLETLSETFGEAVSAPDFAAYVYALLAHPGFERRYHRELERREIRVPITRDAALFRDLRDCGRALIRLQTFGEVPPGAAQCVRPVTGDCPDRFSYDAAAQCIHVGDGVFAPVEPAVWEFAVSGLRVVSSWLGYRMRRRRGRRSSPLDDIHSRSWGVEFTGEFLNLLWTLEATLAGYPRQEALLAAVVAGLLALHEKVLESRVQTT